MDLTDWTARFVQIMEETFAERVRFIGIQGSCGRGEATADSDIDMVVILDTFSYADLQLYSHTLDGMEHRGKLCGFISGCRELQCWDSAELFQFYHDTVPLSGDLDWLKPLITPESIRRAIHTGACGIYHACVHNAVHEKEPSALRPLFKSAAFVLQAKHFYDTGIYIRKKTDLIGALSGSDSLILRQSMTGCDPLPFDAASRLLMEWSSGLIAWSAPR